MKTTTKFITVVLTAASLAAVSVAFAHPGGGYGMGGYGPGMGPGMMGGESAAVTAARLSDFKAVLKITAEQEPAWQKFEAATRQQAESRQAFHAAMLAQRQDPKARVDRNAQHEAMLKLFSERETARNGLFAVLTPEQKGQVERPFYGRHGHMSGQAPTQ